MARQVSGSTGRMPGSARAASSGAVKLSQEKALAWTLKPLENCSKHAVYLFSLLN